MSDWKKNKVVGIVAGVIVVVCMVILVTTTTQRRKSREISPKIKAQMEKITSEMQRKGK